MKNNNMPLASFWRRLFASLLDGQLILIVSFLVSFVEGKNLFAQKTPHFDYVSMIIAALYVIISWANFQGATIGKKVFGIKVVGMDNKPIGYVKGFIRYIGYFISSLPLFLGYFWMLWDKNKQTWHDKLSGTKVVQVDNNPKIIQAIIVFILVTVVYFALILGSIFTLAQSKEGKDLVNMLKSGNTGMSPEAKIHFSRYQDLLKQAQIISDNQYLPLEERERQTQPIADEFINELKTATQLDPQNPEIWSELGGAYSWPNTVSTKEDGLNAYKKALELNPTHTAYMNYIGYELIDLGRYSEAVDILNKSISLYEGSSGAHHSLGTAYAKLNKYDLAKKHLQRALDIYLKLNTNHTYDNDIINTRKELNSLPQ